jgi:hypothetical protein
MADIQQLSYPYFTDNSTALNASNLNPIIAKINELVVKVNSDSPSPTPTPTVSTPTITINGTSATIACATSGATIYYTTNGDIPTSSSTQYSSAITLSGTGTLKAIAIKDNTSSEVASKKYPVNLFDVTKMTVALGVQSSDGLITNSSTDILSDWIPVTANTQYTFKARKIVCWYDSAKQFISASPSNESSITTLTAPANAAYCRFSFPYNSWRPEKMIVNIGATLGSDTEANEAVYPPNYPNLVNSSTCKVGVGLSSSSGQEVTGSSMEGYDITDYIVVTANTQYAFLVRWNVCWYDSSKQFISGDGSANQLTKVLTAPANAAYCRFSWFNASIGVNDVIMNQGDVLVV